MTNTQSCNRVTQAHIDTILATSTWSDTKMGEKTTIVCCRLPNGFEVIESSGCVDPANYDHALGVSICKRRIVDKVWLLEGYALADRIFRAYHAQSPMLLPGFAEVAARIAHEVNRAYCQSIGDDSQPRWEDAPAWQRESAIAGVEFHLEHPEATPGQSHQEWMEHKIIDGWTYGEVKDPAAKTHPCMRPYAELPQAQRSKDYLFRAVIHALKGNAK